MGGYVECLEGLTDLLSLLVASADMPVDMLESMLFWSAFMTGTQVRSGSIERGLWLYLKFGGARVRGESKRRAKLGEGCCRHGPSKDDASQYQ